MRRVYLFATLLFAASLFAQQSPDYTQTQTEASPAQTTAKPAPKPGQPLDPEDVAILTGKKDAAERSQRYASPQMYNFYPANSSIFTQSSVGNAFMGDPNIGYGNGSGYSYRRGNSSFVNTWFFGHRGTLKPGGAPSFFFGTNTPGSFHNRWQPGRVWFGPGSHFRGPTGFVFLPGLQP